MFLIVMALTHIWKHRFQTTGRLNSSQSVRSIALPQDTWRLTLIYSRSQNVLDTRFALRLCRIRGPFRKWNGFSGIRSYITTPRRTWKCTVIPGKQMQDMPAYASFYSVPSIKNARIFCLIRLSRIQCKLYPAMTALQAVPAWDLLLSQEKRTYFICSLK